MPKGNFNSNHVRLECGHIRSVVKKSPRPGIGDQLYCLRCDETKLIVEKAGPHYG